MTPGGDILWTLTGLTLGCGAIIGLVHVCCRLIALRFQDAPDSDPYLDRLLGEIEAATRKTLGGAEAASGSGSGNANSDIAHRGEAL